jgi:hypothetical protein
MPIKYPTTSLGVHVDSRARVHAMQPSQLQKRCHKHHTSSTTRQLRSLQRMAEFVDSALRGLLDSAMWRTAHSRPPALHKRTPCIPRRLYESQMHARQQTRATGGENMIRLRLEVWGYVVSDDINRSREETSCSYEVHVTE